MHHENRVDGQEEAEQQAIEKGLVVGHDEQALVLEISLPGANLDAEQQAAQAAQQRAQEWAEHQPFSRT